MILRDYQLEAVDAARQAARKYSRILLNMATGCHSPDSMILMFDGSIKKASEIKLGDLLIGPDGKKRCVLNLHSGTDEMVEVSSKKIEPFVVNQGHVLSLYMTPKRKDQVCQIQNLPVSEWPIQNSTFKHCAYLYRPGKQLTFERILSTPERYCSPYLLGAYLADGSYSKKSKSLHLHKHFKSWFQLVQHESSFLLSDGYSAKRFQDKERHLKAHIAVTRGSNGFGKKDGNAWVDYVLGSVNGDIKTVPEWVKYGPVKTRAQYLAGVLDGDGHCDGNRFELTFKHKKQIEDIRFIALSIGLCVTKIASKWVQLKTWDTAREYFRIQFAGDFSSVPLIEKKITRTRQKNNPSLFKPSFRNIGVGKYCGWEVDGDNLYLDADFIVHHNSGKSAIIGEIARLAKSRVLVLCHQAEILKQNQKAFTALSGGEPSGIFCAGLGEKDLSHRVTFAHRDSLGNALEQVQKYPIVIADECHLLSTRKISRYQQILEATNYDILLGLTATPYRLSGGKIYGKKGFFEYCAYTMNIRNLVARGYLSKYNIKIHTTLDTEGVATKGNDFDESELSAKALQKVSLDASCQKILEKTKERRCTLIFCVGREHAKEIQKRLPGCEYIDGETKQSDRDVLLDNMRSGKVKYCVNVGVLTTGTDIPLIDCVVMLRPTQSASLFVQCLDDKTEVLTKAGWRNIDTISETDTAITFCVDTGFAKESLVKKIFKRDIGLNEDFYAIETGRQSIGVTGGHNLLVKGRRIKKFAFEQADISASRKEMFHVPVSGKNDKQDCHLSDDEIKFIAWSITDAHIGLANIVISQSTKKHAEEIESLLIRLNFRYGKSVRFDPSNFKRNSPVAIFNISYAEPRKISDRDKKGCGKLKKYLSREMPFEEFSERQFDLLMETIIKADGHVIKNPKSKGKKYKQSSFCIGKNKVFIDRLQSLCVRNGWRADVTEIRNDNFNVLSVSKFSFKTIGGKNNTDRKSLQKENYIGKVWCISTDQKTIVTRRNGRVTIMGNCVGRGIRIHPDKKDLLILELTDNFERFGSLDDPMLFGTNSEPEITEGIGLEPPPQKICPECDTPSPNGTRVCPFCGMLFLKKREDYSDEEILELEVKTVSYAPTITKNGNNAFVVTFKTELGVIKEWLNVQNPNPYVAQMAQAKLRKLREAPVEIIKVRGINQTFPRILSYHIDS